MVLIPDSLLRRTNISDPYAGNQAQPSTGGNDSNTAIGDGQATGTSTAVSPFGHEDKQYKITVRSELRGTYSTLLQPGVAPIAAGPLDPNEADFFILRGSQSISVGVPAAVPASQQNPGQFYRARAKTIYVAHITETDSDAITWASNIKFGGYATAPTAENGGIITINFPSTGSGDGGSGSGSGSGSDSGSGSTGSTQTIDNLAVWIPGSGSGNTAGPVLPTHANSFNLFRLDWLAPLSNWTATWITQDADPGTDSGNNPSNTTPPTDPSADPDLTDENGNPVNPGQPDQTYDPSQIGTPTAKTDKTKKGGKGSGLLFWLSQAIPYGISQDAGATWKYHFGAAGVPPASSGTGTGTTTPAPASNNPPWTSAQSHAAIGASSTIVVAGQSGLYTTTSIGQSWALTQAGSFNWVATDGASNWIATGSAGQFYSTTGKAPWTAAPLCPVSGANTVCDVFQQGFDIANGQAVEPSPWASTVTSGTGTVSDPWSQLGFYNLSANIPGAIQAAGVTVDQTTSLAQATFNLTYSSNQLSASVTFSGGAGNLVYTGQASFSGGVPMDGTGHTTQSIVVNLTFDAAHSNVAGFVDSGILTFTIPSGWKMPVDNSSGGTVNTYPVALDQTFGGGTIPVGPASSSGWTQQSDGGGGNYLVAGGPNSRSDDDQYPHTLPAGGTTFAFWDRLQIGGNPSSLFNPHYTGPGCTLHTLINLPSNFASYIDGGTNTATLTFQELTATYVPPPIDQKENGNINGGVIFLDSSGNNIGSFANVGFFSGDWTQITATGSIPSGARSMVVFFDFWAYVDGRGAGMLALPTLTLNGTFPAPVGANNNVPVQFYMKQATSAIVVSGANGYAFMQKPPASAGGSITTANGQTSSQAQAPTWSTLNTSLPVSYPANFLSTGGAVFASTIGAGHIYKSADAQGGWVEVTPTNPAPSGNLHLVYNAGSLIALDEGSGRVYVSANLGASWSRPTATPPFDGKSGMGFLTATAGRLICGHTGTVTWFYSDDNGMTWKVRAKPGAWTAPLATTNTVPVLQEIDG